MIPYILTALGGYLIGSSVKQYASGGQVYQFDYNCVYPSCGDELEFIIANMKPISADEFLRNVSLEEVNNSLMYGIKYESKARLKSDYSVSFYKLKKAGIDAYILVNSAIEYVFKKTSYASGGQIKLLAPNGKPSNLTPEQYKLVRTPEFKAWFGDWENDPENASKVVDENGEPLICYHSTQSDFNVFKEAKNTIGVYGKGFYFGNSKGYVSVYNRGENQKIISVFLKIINPIIIQNDVLPIGYEIYSDMMGGYDFQGNPLAASKGSSASFTIKAKSQNYDGVIAEVGYRDKEFVAFYPNQIKLGSNTTFDGSNPDIRYAQGGIVLEYLIHWTNRDGLEGIFKDKFLNEETSLTDSLKLPFDKENNMPFGIKLKNVPRKLLVKKGDTLLEKKHEYRTKRKLKIDEYFDGFVVRNNTNKNRLEKYLDNSFAFWDNDILRKYFREHNNDYQIKIKN